MEQPNRPIYPDARELNRIAEIEFAQTMKDTLPMTDKTPFEQWVRQNVPDAQMQRVDMTRWHWLTEAIDKVVADGALACNRDEIIDWLGTGHLHYIYAKTSEPTLRQIIDNTSNYGFPLPTARELWERLVDILAWDLIQSITGKDETTKAVEDAREWLASDWPMLADYPAGMVSDFIYHNRDKDDFPYSQETADEIITELGLSAPDLLIEDTDDALPDSQLLTDWRAAGERVATATDDAPELDFEDFPPELDFEALMALHASTWPWNVKDALRRFVGVAMTEAGIDDKAKRLAVQERLTWLFGEA